MPPARDAVLTETSRAPSASPLCAASPRPGPRSSRPHMAQPRVVYGEMHTLSVEGPYRVPCEVNDRGTKHISAKCGRDFFQFIDGDVKDGHGLARHKGCYLFAIQTRSLRAAYVGKATKTFGQEVFAADKLLKYNTAVHRWPHGTPVLLFVIMPHGIRSAKLI